VTFLLSAPQARSVALAGDFNDWDASRVLMRREASGLWTVDVPLTPGRYRYVFVVDGRRFVADPAAPRAAGDDFGTPTSVVTVGGGALRAAGGSL
jgi:1,4-alpha-glucan branching enzyme